MTKQLLFKRYLDVSITLLTLVVISPLLMAVACLIKFTSKGPIFFKQTRVGLNGKHFQMYKFRSMVMHAEELKKALLSTNEMKGPAFKMKHDPRITKIGRFIRKYSIDELPQLLNVVKGDMSIVGNRPTIPSEVAQYKNWHKMRFNKMAPGLTGIYQVNKAKAKNFDDWAMMDLQYIANWNLMLDFKLIAKTIPVVIRGSNS